MVVSRLLKLFFCVITFLLMVVWLGYRFIRLIFFFSRRHLSFLRCLLCFLSWFILLLSVYASRILVRLSHPRLDKLYVGYKKIPSHDHDADMINCTFPSLRPFLAITHVTCYMQRTSLHASHECQCKAVFFFTFHLSPFCTDKPISLPVFISPIQITDFESSA
jgi:hypothetical protein